MASPNLPTAVVAGGTGHVDHTNTVHAVVNAFDTTVASASSGQVLVSNGTVLTPRALLSTDIPGLVTNPRTASYTLNADDAGKLVEMNMGSSNTITVPSNASVAFPVGTVINIRQYGAGVTTVTPAAGVTIRSRGNLFATAGAYAEASIMKRGTDEWILTGDLA